MNHDFLLKVRMNNIFWSLDCYTRLEVKLSEYSLQTRTALEVTDLDVLGIRILPDLSFDYLVADCTCDKKRIKSPIQRVFWLRGVMDFFKASKGYLSLGTMNSILEVQRNIANKLGITILNENNLNNLEKRIVNSELEGLKLSIPDSWEYFEYNLANLSETLKQLLDYRKYWYWIYSSNSNIHSLISLVTKHNKFFVENNIFNKALALDLLTLFSLSVLQMSSYVFNLNPENPTELRAYFYGGATELRRREYLYEKIKRLSEIYQPQINLGESLNLDPNYLPKLFEIAFRFINKPYDSRQIPRYLQIILFEKTLYKNENTKGIEYIEKNFSDITKKLARDIAKFFCYSTGLSEKLFEDVFN